MPSRTSTTVDTPPISMSPNGPLPAIIGSVFFGRRPGGHVDGVPVEPCARRDRARVRARDLEAVTMNVDRVTVHAQVREAMAKSRSTLSSALGCTICRIVEPPCRQRAIGAGDDGGKDARPRAAHRSF